MKETVLKTIVLTLAFFCTTQLFAQTTQEEYNYITKGYKIQIESGLDMKKGYLLNDLGDWGLNTGTEKRNCEFKALIRDGESKPCAIMMIYKRIDIANGAKYYICIPSSDSSSEIWDQTLNFITTTFKDSDKMSRTVIWALMKFSSQEVTN
ncbi:MAG: hypothetical protein RBT65_14025 [Methanolobus sp.]|jgi:hypothetical protein|nr:hypothetical protein [Methanolobus sp.]